MRQEDRMQKNKPQELVKEKACRPFGLRDKLGYLFGDFGNDFSFIFASTYLMVFYTKVLGISGAVVGTLFLAARGVDAFTDITMGRIAEPLPRREGGRFRPLDPQNVRARGSVKQRHVFVLCEGLALWRTACLYGDHLSGMGKLLLHSDQYPLRFHGISDQSGAQGQSSTINFPESGCFSCKSCNRKRGTSDYLSDR